MTFCMNNHFYQATENKDNKLNKWKWEKYK